MYICYIWGELNAIEPLSSLISQRIDPKSENSIKSQLQNLQIFDLVTILRSLVYFDDISLFKSRFLVLESTAASTSVSTTLIIVIMLSKWFNTFKGRFQCMNVDSVGWRALEIVRGVSLTWKHRTWQLLVWILVFKPISKGYHKNIIRYHTCWEENDFCYLQLEFCPFGTLKQLCCYNNVFSVFHCDYCRFIALYQNTLSSKC